MQTRAFVVVRVLAAVVCVGFGGHVYAQTPYYQGKTIRLIQGREGGGSGDVRSRAVIPFLRKHIPGNPSIVSEFMPGGWRAQSGQLHF